MENNYEPCQKCGGERVLNPKTGKIFCKDKCWLKQGQPKTYYSQEAGKVVDESYTNGGAIGQPQPAMAVIYDDIMAEFKKVNERLDKLIIFLTKK